MANALRPNAIVSASTPTAVRRPAAASTCSTRRRRSTRCRRARRFSSPRSCGTSCRRPGWCPPTYIGTGGLNPRSDIAGLNLAQYPSILVELGNMKNPADSGLITTPEGRQKYADAVVRGIAGFLGAQPR